MKFKKLCFAILSIGLMFTACKKDNISEEDRKRGMESTEDYLEASQTFQNLFTTMDKEAKQQGDLNGFKNTDDGAKVRNGCPEVTLDLTENTIFPATLILDYGEGCTTADNKSASGKVSMVFTGLLLSSGTSITVTYENFEYNNYKVGGTYQISNDGKDANDFLTFTAKVIDGTLTDPEGKTIKHTSTSVRKFIEGFDTNFWTNGLDGINDDVWSVTETASGVSREGITYELSTIKDLRAEVDCKWPVSGELSLNLIEPAIESSVDFGDGNCDNKAMLQINDYVTEIEL